MPQGYELAFQRALWTFSHQTVFCPRSGACVPLRPLPPGGLAASSQLHGRILDAAQEAGGSADPTAFLGRILPNDIACEVAEGGPL